MVDLSRRTGKKAPAESEIALRKSGPYRSGYEAGPRWPRPGENRANATIRNRNAGGDPATERDSGQDEAADRHGDAAEAVSATGQDGDASQAGGYEDASPDMSEDAGDIATGYRSYETDAEPEGQGTAPSGSAWAATPAAPPEQTYRSCHTPAAERLQRLGAVDMVDDLVAAEADEQPALTPDAPAGPDPYPDDDQHADDEAAYDRETEAETDESAAQTAMSEDESAAGDDECIADRLVPASTVAAALARQAPQTQPDADDDPTHPFTGCGHAGQEQVPSRPTRMPATPKWSESARQHMSNLLAASEENNSAAAIAARIDTSAERHRRSSAMLLLGLPALLLIGFGGVYMYHADMVSKGRSIIVGLQSAVSATTAGVATEQTLSPSGKIADSIIEKQEAEKAADAAPALPPPVAPDLAEQPASAPVEAAGAQPAAPAAVSPPSDSERRSGITLNWPDAKKPAAAERPEPAIKSEPRTDTAVPNVAIAAPATPARIRPPEEGNEPTITPTAADPLPPGVIAGNPAAAGNGPAETEKFRQVAALNPPETAVTQTRPEMARAATPAEPATGPGSAAEQDDASAQLIARGRERLEIGDIVAARLLFEVAVSNGSAAAAAAMGRSYDPIYFETMAVRGVRPDADTAAEWYEKAIAAGDTAAKADLQKLTARLKQ